MGKTASSARASGLFALSIALCAAAAPGMPSGRCPLGGAMVGFELRLGSAAEKAPSRVVAASDMKSFSMATNADGRISCVWKGHPLLGAGFNAVAVFEPQPSGGWTYRFLYCGNASGLDVEEIVFPVVEVPRTDGTRFLYPRQTGLLELPSWQTAKPGARVVTFGPRFVGFRFAAVMDETLGNWYADARDEARRWPVSFNLYNGKGSSPTASFSLSCAMPCEPGTTAGALPYGGTIRPFRGDWFAAASIYRDWAARQPWYAAATALRASAPRLRDIGLWLWNRGRCDTVTGIVDRVLADTGAKIALDWYWWHDIPYGAQAPHYWPPREPYQLFSRTIAAMKAKGVYVQHYINGMCCDADDPRWTAADQAETAVLRNGSYMTSLFNRFFGHRSAWMCGNAPIFSDRISMVTRNLAGAGGNSIYVDMIANDACYACWSPSHGHPRGGGTHVTDGYHRLVERLRRENPGVHLSSEEETEAFLDVFESLIVLYGGYERFGFNEKKEMLPVYPAIYHTATTLYGSYATIDNVPPWDEKWPADKMRHETRDLVADFPDHFAVELARPVVWGIQPCVHNLLARHAEERRLAADYRFLCDTVKFYWNNRDLLYDGEMCAPGRIETARTTAEFLMRGTYTANGVYLTNTHADMPTVFHSVWRAPSGKVAAVLVNWTRSPQRYRLETPDLGTLSGELPPRSWVRRVR